MHRSTLGSWWTLKQCHELDMFHSNWFAATSLSMTPGLMDRLAAVPSKKATVPTERDAARPARRKANAETLIVTNSEAFVWRRHPERKTNFSRSFCFYTFVQTHSCTPSPRDSLCMKAVQQRSIPSKIEQGAWDMQFGWHQGNTWWVFRVRWIGLFFPV